MSADRSQERVVDSALRVARNGGGVEDLVHLLIGSFVPRRAIDSAVEVLERADGDEAARRASYLLRLSRATGAFAA